MVPALLVLFELPIHNAIGTSMMVIVPIAIAGALRHYSLNNVNCKLRYWQVGRNSWCNHRASIIEKIPAFYVKRVFALFLIYSAIRLWFSK